MARAACCPGRGATGSRSSGARPSRLSGLVKRQVFGARLNRGDFAQGRALGEGFAHGLEIGDGVDAEIEERVALPGENPGAFAPSDSGAKMFAAVGRLAFTLRQVELELSVSTKIWKG